MPKLPTRQAMLDPVYMIDDFRQIGRGADYAYFLAAWESLTAASIGRSEDDTR
jgi:hypothetical protein